MVVQTSVRLFHILSLFRAINMNTAVRSLAFAIVAIFLGSLAPE